MVTAAKTTSQIGLHMGVAFAIMYAATGSVAFGGIAAILEPICNVILLPIHDRIWAVIRAKIDARQTRAANRDDAAQRA
jgi:uncharacterized membrane protein